MLLQPFLLLLLLLSVIHSVAASAATATLHPVGPTPSTIPAFPEQSAVTASSSCPITLPLRRPPPSLHPSCSPSSGRLRCCPSLATLLFASYPLRHPSSNNSTKPGGFDMPEVPEDTETCSEEVGKALRDAGVAISYHNASCDLVFCYCGIRLHRLSCDMDDGVFQDRVGLLARDCVSPGITGCSKCLASLYTLGSGINNLATSYSSNKEDRTTKMHDQDCQLMGLTWLLAKNHPAYAPTFTAVFRAMMSTPNGSDPKSCTIGSDGLPLAVESSEVSGNLSRPMYSTHWSVLLGGISVALVCSFHFSFLVI